MILSAHMRRPVPKALKARLSHACDRAGDDTREVDARPDRDPDWVIHEIVDDMFDPARG